MGSIDCLEDIATSLDLFFKGLSDCGLLREYNVQFLKRDMLDIASKMKFKLVVHEFLSNMLKSLENGLVEDVSPSVEEPLLDGIFEEIVLPDNVNVFPEPTYTKEIEDNTALNVSSDESVTIEELTFDQIFDDIASSEQITVASELTPVGANLPESSFNGYVESSAHIRNVNTLAARLMYSDREKSDISEPWQVSILENQEVDTTIDTITEVITKNHLTDVGWQCDMCSKVFPKMGELQHHCRAEHNGTGCFECNLCNARLMTKVSLKRHIRAHSGIKNNTCEICLKSFKRADYLATHYKLHQGVRPHKCRICQKEFTSKTGLQLHERVHSDQKDYNCHQCNKSFTRRDKLRDHVLRHLKIRRFQCSICNKRYAEKRDLRTHLKVHDQ